jgi:cellulose synthase/poly-beta-1,6-N-acetylglucosamine synthase-like glycosyltransferase
LLQLSTVANPPLSGSRNLATVDPSPLVSVVIPAKNEEDHIEACLASVLAQDHEDLEVLVVDGASTDRTCELVEAVAARDPRVRLLHNPRGIIPVALNLALAEARGRWLVRVDSHAAVPPDYVRLAVQHLETGRWGGVGGRKDGVGRTPAGKAVAAAMASPFGVGNSTYHYGTETRTVEHIPFGAYPVALARELGGWNEDLRVNQDFEFDWRVRASGHELLFDPALRIDWHSRQTVRELYAQYRRYGKGKVKVAALHPASVRPRHLVAPALVGGLAGGAALSVLTRRARWFVLPAAAYGAGVAVATAKTAAKVEPEGRRFLPAAFAAMHIGWGLGFWEGVLERLPSRRSGT